MISYQDYLNYARNQQGSEGTNDLMSMERWGALNPDQQWGLLGGNFGLTPEDSRYGDLKQQVGGEANRVIQVGRNPIADSDLVNPSQQVRGNGWSAHSEDNQTPDYQDRIGMSGDILKMFLATGAGITGLAGMMGAFGAPFTSAMGAAPGQGFGTLGYNGAAGILDGAGALGASATNAASSGAPYGTDAVEAAGWFGGPGAATNPSPGLFGSSASTGLMGSLGQGLNGLLGSALKNPLQALGLLQMAGGLLGRGNDGASNSGPSGDSGTFNLPKGNRGEWTPNPFTQRQIQNFRYGGG